MPQVAIIQFRLYAKSSDAAAEAVHAIRQDLLTDAGPDAENDIAPLTKPGRFARELFRDWINIAKVARSGNQRPTIADGVVRLAIRLFNAPLGPRGVVFEPDSPRSPDFVHGVCRAVGAFPQAAARKGVGASLVCS
jgi:hypothetical protein